MAYLKMAMSMAMRAAVFGACCLPAAGHADSGVTFYGLLDATVRYAVHAGAGGRHQYTMGDGAFTGTRLGFRGAEDLGAGTKAFFSIEQGFDPSSGQLMQATGTANYGQSVAPAGRAFGRETLVGLTAASAGTLTFGRQYTLANVYSSRFQPHANPNQEALALLVGHQLVRQDNMVKYAVGVGALSFSASRTLGEGGSGSSWAVGAGFKRGRIDVTAYASEMDSFDSTETRRIQALGGAFELTASLKAYAGAMRRSHRVSAQTNEVWVAALSYTLGRFAYSVSYGEDRQHRVAEGARKLGWLCVDYMLSERTDMYGVLDSNRVVGAYPVPAFMAGRGTQRGMELGLRHRF